MRGGGQHWPRFCCRDRRALSLERRSRAERRRIGRSAPPPKRRDPIVWVYIGFAVLLAFVLAGFGLSNWIQNRAQVQALAFDMSTPAPRASGMPAVRPPIQLRDGQPVGMAVGFTKANLQRGISADTAAGGHGEPVDGIQCQSEMVQVHLHSHLALFVNGHQIQIPGTIGMAPTPQGGCLYWLHTHGPDGIIHVEALTPNAPAGGHYTLGMFFDVWGTPLSRSQVGPFKGAVTAFVNGTRFTGGPRGIPLRSHQDITLELGRPVVPPEYRLPPND